MNRELIFLCISVHVNVRPPLSHMLVCVMCVSPMGNLLYFLCFHFLIGEVHRVLATLLDGRDRLIKLDITN